jgi:hypothetical protein
LKERRGSYKIFSGVLSKPVRKCKTEKSRKKVVRGTFFVLLVKPA